MKTIFILCLLSFSLNILSQDINDSIQNDVTKQKEFNEIIKIFSTGKMSSGLKMLECCEISYDGNYLGLYFVDVLAKTYQYKLLKIEENGFSEIELLGETNPIEHFQNRIGFSKDSKQFYSFTTNMELYIWCTKTGELLKEFNGISPDDGISPYAFVPNGAFLYDESTGNVSSNYFIIHRKNLIVFNGKISEPFRNCASTTILKTTPTTIAFNHDNDVMAIAGLFAKKANVYDLKTGQIICTLNSTKKGITAMQFTSNNQLLIAEKLIMNKFDIDSGVGSILFPLDKTCYDMSINCYDILAYSTTLNTMFLWDLNHDVNLMELPKPFKLTFKLLFSYDGKDLYAISGRGEIIKWEISYN